MLLIKLIHAIDTAGTHIDKPYKKPLVKLIYTIDIACTYISIKPIKALDKTDSCY